MQGLFWPRDHFTFPPCAHCSSAVQHASVFVLDPPVQCPPLGCAGAAAVSPGRPQCKSCLITRKVTGRKWPLSGCTVAPLYSHSRLFTAPHHVRAWSAYTTCIGVVLVITHTHAARTHTTRHRNVLSHIHTHAGTHSTFTWSVRAASSRQNFVPKEHLFLFLYRLCAILWGRLAHFMEKSLLLPCTLYAYRPLLVLYTSVLETHTYTHARTHARTHTQNNKKNALAVSPGRLQCRSCLITRKVTDRKYPRYPAFGINLQWHPIIVIIGLRRPIS